VVEIERLVHVFQNGACVFRCTVKELVPTIKAYFSKHIIDKHPSDVAFHAACLVRDGRGLLISGHPGAGKTTLALHLMESGFDYGSDDITLISPDGRAEGIPFAPAIKPGAWPLVRKFRKDLDDAIVHERPDGQRVRYLKASRPAPNGSCAVGWIVFIRRRPKVAAKLAPLGELEALSRLIEASCSAHGKMTNRAFHAIRRTLAAANPLELTYSSATQARDALVDLCDGQQ
jgi:hypothetical protein